MQGKFSKDKGKKKTPGINMSSLPDIVFILLFFFMVVTVFREVEPLVQTELPEASEEERLEKRSLIATIYIGPPVNPEAYGTAPRIQLDDSFASVEEIREFVSKERDKRHEDERDRIIWSLEVDVETTMGIVTDVKQELREEHALRLNYSTFPTTD